MYPCSIEYDGIKFCGVDNLFHYLLFDGFFELFLQQGVEFGIKNMFLGNNETEYKINLPIELGFRVWQ